MLKELRKIAIVLLGCVLIFTILYAVSQKGIWLTLAITFGTISYHFFMRLLVGFLYNTRMKNQADTTKKWYQMHPWEQELYEVLHVKNGRTKCPLMRKIFLITSVAAACFDMLFVIIQRYNRSRIMKLAKSKKK